MKMLLFDNSGVYDATGKLISQYIGEKKVNYGELVLKFGFELSDIKDVNIMRNKSIITANLNTDYKKVIFSLKNENSFIIVSGNFNMYDCISFDTPVKLAVSNDGVNWRAYLNSVEYLHGEFDIKELKDNEAEISRIESESYTLLRNFVNHYSKKVDVISNNNFIKYILIMLPIDGIENINTNVNISDKSNIRDNQIAISYDSNFVRVENSHSLSLKTLKVKIMKTNNRLITLEEF